MDSFVSVVIPVYCEEESVEALAGETMEVLREEFGANSFELIFVDDGSNDNTPAILLDLTAKHSEIRAIFLKRNLGQTYALSRGFNATKGDVVVAMDGDGQNNPSNIPALVSTLAGRDVDCVSGWRERRSGDNPLRVGISRFANWILRLASGVKIHDSGCTLKAYRGSVVRTLSLRGDMHRLIPFQIELLGGVVLEQPVDHRARYGGTSKYTLSRTFRVAQDIVSAYFLRRFMHRPMHLIGTVAVSLTLLGSMGVLVAVLLKLAGIYDFVETPILLLGLTTAMAGLNLLGVGFISEMVGRAAAMSVADQYPFSRIERS